MSGIKISQLGSLKEQLVGLKFDPGPKGDRTKVVKFQADIDGVMDRIARIEAGRKDEMRWIGDINNFVGRIEKLCEVKFVEDRLEHNAEGQQKAEPVPEGTGSQGVEGRGSPKK